jgi:hypothetical protein
MKFNFFVLNVEMSFRDAAVSKYSLQTCSEGTRNGVLECVCTTGHTLSVPSLFQLVCALLPALKLALNSLWRIKSEFSVFAFSELRLKRKPNPQLLGSATDFDEIEHV